MSRETGNVKMAAEADSSTDPAALLAGLSLSKARLKRRKSIKKTEQLSSTTRNDILSSSMAQFASFQEEKEAKSSILTTKTVPAPAAAVPSRLDKFSPKRQQHELLPLSQDDGSGKGGVTRERVREEETFFTVEKLKVPPQEEGTGGGDALPGDTGSHGNQETTGTVQTDDADTMVAVIFTIQRVHPLKAKLSMCSLAIRISCYNHSTGSLLEKSSSTHSAVSYYERDNPSVNYVLPIMSKPCSIGHDSRGMLQATWGEEAIFQEHKRHIFAENVTLLLELVELSQQTAPVTIAWGRVLINSIPLDREFGVKLFYIPKHWYQGKRTVQLTTDSSELLRVNKPRSYPTVLYLSAEMKSAALLETASEMFVLRSTTPVMPETSQESLLSKVKSGLKGSVHSILSVEQKPVQWNRLPGQVCGIPETVSTSLTTGSGGCCALSFSPSGRLLAVGCDDGQQFVVKIYQVIGWSLVCTLPSDNGMIYKLCWSPDENYLACASASGLCHVWSFMDESELLLPHPSYVYSCEWIYSSSDRTFVVTCCYDKAIRCWRHNQLTHVEVVSSSVNVLTFDTKQSILFSADSEGIINLWAVDKENCSLQLHKTLAIPEYKGASIRQLLLLPWPQQLVVYIPKAKNPLTKLDLRIESITTTYQMANTQSSSIFAGVCISPCGVLLIATVSNFLTIWDTGNGKCLHVYQCPLLRCPGLVCEYHPYEHMFVASGMGHHQVVTVLVPA